jgi:hypothetical protein
MLAINGNCNAYLINGHLAEAASVDMNRIYREIKGPASVSRVTSQEGTPGDQNGPGSALPGNRPILVVRQITEKTVRDDRAAGG